MRAAADRALRTQQAPRLHHNRVGLNLLSATGLCATRRLHGADVSARYPPHLVPVLKRASLLDYLDARSTLGRRFQAIAAKGSSLTNSMARPPLATHSCGHPGRPARLAQPVPCCSCGRQGLAEPCAPRNSSPTHPLPVAHQVRLGDPAFLQKFPLADVHARAYTSTRCDSATRAVGY